MAYYDRFKKRLDVVSLRVNESQPFDVSTLDPAVIDDPTKDIEYIYYLLSENKIHLELGLQEHVVQSLEALGIKDEEK